jgi:ubiquinone/menaquinone biosynthesis C-methylase UbiE
MGDIISGMIGDNYFNRRKEVMDRLLLNGNHDPILTVMNQLNIIPTRVLEIGCSNGWRLELIKNRHNVECLGIDPSDVAIRDGCARFPDIYLYKGMADDLPFADNDFDLVIFGHCLYTCQRSDLFQIASEADRVLHDGYLVLLDFFPDVPYSHPNPDCFNVFTYKMDYSKMFSWHPCYHIIYRNIFKEQGRIEGNLGLFVFRKDKTNV